MKNVDTSPYFQSLLQELKATQSPIFAKDISAAISALEQPFTHTDALIGAVQAGSRMLTIIKGNLTGNEAFKHALNALNLPSWKDSAPIDYDPNVQEILGHRIYNIADGQQNPCANILIGFGANYIAKAIIEKLMVEKIPFLISVVDEVFFPFGHQPYDG
jgi:hypothetical protein